MVVSWVRVVVEEKLGKGVLGRVKKMGGERGKRLGWEGGRGVEG